MPPGKTPPATENDYVTGTRAITVPQKSMRVPAEGRGQVVIKRPSYTTTEQFKAYKQYTNPDVMAKNEINNLPEGSALAKVQQKLWAAGFYGSSDVIPSGYRTPDDYAAMKAAMEAANARGVMWEDEAANRVYLASTGASATTGAGTAGSSKGSAINKSLNITGPKSARATFNEMYMKYTSKTGSDKEFAQFYDSLVKAQQKAPIQYKKQKIGGTWYNVQVSDGVDASQFAETWVFNKINFADDELAGVAAQNMTAVNELSKMYNVNLSLAQKAQFAKALTTGTETDNDVRKSLAEKAKLKYKVLANDITETVTVQDLLAEQMASYANTLELDPKTVKVSDVEKYAFKDGQLLNASETAENVKNTNVAYRSTGQAKQNASAFAIGLARTLGYGV